MLLKPCNGYVTSFFDKARLNPVLKVVRPHWGVDYGNTPGRNNILAAADGTVRSAFFDSKGYGNVVFILHDIKGVTYETVYAHLATINVKAGQTVKRGQGIGIKGTTGNSTGIHLHFEVHRGRWNNKFTNAVDPLLHVEDPDIKALQTSLNKLGIKVAIDGLYGDATKNAIATFQRHNSLTVDGYAGRATFDSVDKKVKELVQVAKKEEHERNAKPSPTLAAEFNEAVELGITDGTYPKRPATREEVAVMILRAIKRVK